MTEEEFTYLSSAQGQSALQHLEQYLQHDTNLYQATLRLRKSYGPQISALVHQIELRRKARYKFRSVDELLFTQPALEQATREEISRYVAHRFIGYHTADLTAGIGADAWEIFQQTSGFCVEKDPLRHKIVSFNLKRLSQDIPCFCLSAEEVSLDTVDCVYLDPARRDQDGRRTAQIDLWQPHLPSYIPQIRDTVSGIGIKASPACDISGQWHDQQEIEFIGWGHQTKQVMFWLGVLASEARRRVTLLPSGWTCTEHDLSHDVPVVNPQTYIIDPHSAILRAGLVDQFATQFSLSKLHPQIGYLTADHVPEFPAPELGRVYRILDVSKYNRKSLAKTLKSFSIYSAHLRQRGFPYELDPLYTQLGIREGNDYTILFTRLGPSLYSIITEKVA